MSEWKPVDAGMAGTIDVGGDLTVNRLSLGAMRITGEGTWGEPADRDQAKAVLRRAIASAAVISPIGRLSQKIHCQAKPSVTRPPITGPSTVDSPAKLL